MRSDRSNNYRNDSKIVARNQRWFNVFGIAASIQQEAMFFGGNVAAITAHKLCIRRIVVSGTNGLRVAYLFNDGSRYTETISFK